MPLPLNVDRPVRETPWVTYGLIAANVIVFLTTIMVSNTDLPADREDGRVAIHQIIAQYGGSEAAIQSLGLAHSGGDDGSGGDSSGGNAGGSTSGGDSSGNQFLDGNPGLQIQEQIVGGAVSDAPTTTQDQLLALLLVEHHPETPDRERLL